MASSDTAVPSAAVKAAVAAASGRSRLRWASARTFAIAEALGSSFPGFPKVADDPVVRSVAAELGATPSQVGLAWLLTRSPNTLPIACTSSIGQLEENLGARDVVLDADALARLNGVYAPATDPLANGDGVEAFLDEGR
jgi:diketogulonate reductase-like aldo/keto reductase